LIIYIVNISINFFTYFSAIGLWVQTKQFTYQFKSYAFASTIICLITAYYLVAVFVCFCAYREFKAMVFDAGMGGGFGMGGMMNRAQPGAPGG
jgi:hypothetical protein